ncbi:hypothetical protein A1QO_04260 [Vibrio genomosp. F10 str. ZF-129]|uniref:Uncharacterized protein n=1 Tax=Vibrio genomosp. F10 str. ZF-129 TaxID=1187848 RepID=A0A1E5BIR5_9VIBR|nr:hypothetical protein [Vibrio genomosp. F10]OEE37326.1 hypothetical protein A1QO_04260 [Vibrio genomosp. F10 str. ZF-129]
MMYNNSYSAIIGESQKFQAITLRTDTQSFPSLYCLERKAVVGLRENSPLDLEGGMNAMNDLASQSTPFVVGTRAYFFPVRFLTGKTYKLGAKPARKYYGYEKLVERSQIIIYSNVTGVIEAIASNLNEEARLIDKMEKEQNRTDLQGILKFDFLQEECESIRDIIGCRYDELTRTVEETGLPQ